MIIHCRSPGLHLTPCFRISNNIINVARDIRRTSSVEVAAVPNRLSNLAFLLQCSSTDGGGGDEANSVRMSADEATESSRRKRLRAMIRRTLVIGKGLLQDYGLYLKTCLLLCVRL